MSAPPPQPEIIARLSETIFPSFAMLAGMQLDVFSPLKDGPLDSAQIAAAIQVDSAKLGPLLYALVAAGLLQVEASVVVVSSSRASFSFGKYHISLHLLGCTGKITSVVDSSCFRRSTELENSLPKQVSSPVCA